MMDSSVAGHGSAIRESFSVLQRQGLIKDLNLVEDKLPEYLRAIEDGYNHTNPYHNR